MTRSSILDNIRKNEPEVKELHLVRRPETYFPHVSDLVTALAGNRVIESVHLGNDFFPGLCTTTQRALLTAIARVQSLEQVRFDRVTVSVDHLADLVSRSRKLAVLDLNHVDLTGGQGEFSEFEESLFRHPTLERFVLKDIAVAGSEHYCFDRVVRVLGTIPNLSVVKVGARETGQVVFSGLSLTRLLTVSDTLVQFHIANIHLDHLSINRVAHAIKNMPCLKNLSLTNTGLDNLGATKLARALQHITGNAALDVLDLSFNDIGNKGCVALGEATKAQQRVAIILEGNKNIGITSLVGPAQPEDCTHDFSARAA